MQWRNQDFFKGRPKFFEQHSPGAVVKPSESSRNRDIEAFSPQEMKSASGFQSERKEV